jgi:hypothetical protein
MVSALLLLPFIFLRPVVVKSHFDIDIFGFWGYNSGNESDFMSTREMLLQDISIMPDSAVEVLYAVWSMSKWRDETPNAETIAAMNETERRSFDNVEEYIKYIDELEDDDEEI